MCVCVCVCACVCVPVCVRVCARMYLGPTCACMLAVACTRLTAVNAGEAATVVQGTIVFHSICLITNSLLAQLTHP